MSWLAMVWGAMWPNVFAPSVFTVAGIGISHWHHRKSFARVHEAVMKLSGGDPDGQ